MPLNQPGMPIKWAAPCLHSHVWRVEGRVCAPSRVLLSLEAARVFPLNHLHGPYPHACTLSLGFMIRLISQDPRHKRDLTFQHTQDFSFSSSFDYACVNALVLPN